MPNLLAVQLNSPNDAFLPFDYELGGVRSPGVVGVAMRNLKLSRYDHTNRLWTASFTEGSELFTKPRAYLGETLEKVFAWSRSPGAAADIQHLHQRVASMIQGA